MTKAKNKNRTIGWGIIAGLILLVALILFIVLHLAELEHFVQLFRRAQPVWLCLALGLQLVTYWCMGLLWSRAVRMKKGKQLSIGSLARLAIAKLSIDQLIPTTGLSGSLLVVRAMRRQGISTSAALEAMVVDMITYYLSFAVAAILALVILFFHHHVTSLLIQIFSLFTIIVIGIPTSIWWVIRHRNWTPPAWLNKRKIVNQTLRDLRQVSIQRLRNPKLLVIGTLLHLSIFILDGLTLWTMLQVTATSVGTPTAFTALVVGSIAAAVSFVPAGLGSFELGCTTTLTLLGVSLEASLTATLLLRGMTLWLPLIPGMWLARRGV